jgi:hypothetical protein
MDFCPIETCNVEDKESLSEYRGCLLRWNKWLFGAPNSLSNQIVKMMQYDTTFRMINLARELSVNSSHEKVGFNRLLLQFFDSGYAYSQLIMIRKLACDPRQDVISLKRLIKDIKENHRLLTRENYVCYNGLSFESTDGENYLLSDLRQETFDLFCNDPTSNIINNRKQIIPLSLIENLNNKLSSCNNLAPIVHKFIAHADESNTYMNNRNYRVTLDRIAKCHKEICQVFNFISGHLLGIASSALMPLFLGSPSENLDKAFVLTENLNKLNEFWDNRKKNIESWSKEITLGKWLK